MDIKVKEGDDISAAKWNRMADSFERFNRTQERGSASQAPQFGFELCIIKVRNDSDDDRRVGEILEFNDFILGVQALPTQLVWMAGGAVTMANGFGVLLEPLAEPTETQKPIGNCQVFGPARALVNIVDANHKFASPKKDSYVLESCRAGPVRILYQPPGDPGEKTCTVFITQDATGIVKPVSDISKGDDGNCEVWLNDEATGAIINLQAYGADVSGDKICTMWCGFVLPWECD